MNKIITKKLTELKPYSRNARINNDAVESVANSIREFGFRVPILIDKDNVIVAGHTRYKALKKLGRETAECIVVDDLTDEQIRAYRLADNKTAEKADWDYSLLDSEIANILDLDMTQFGFEFEDVVEDDADYDEDSSETRENERVRTISAYNLELFNPKKTEGKWGIPKLLKEKHVPKSLMGFNYVKSAKNYDSGVHFFVDDYQFERVWNDPSKYVQLLAPFDCVLTPDFSLYRDMPLCMQMWNTYRSRLIGQYWQESGLTVIPTVSWCEKESYDFCFDGLPENSVLAISSVGILADSKAMPLFKDGIKELIERKHPTKLIVYGRPIKDFDYGVETVSFSNSVTDRLDGYKRKKRNE